MDSSPAIPKRALVLAVVLREDDTKQRSNAQHSKITRDNDTEASARDLERRYLERKRGNHRTPLGVSLLLSNRA